MGIITLLSRSQMPATRGASVPGRLAEALCRPFFSKFLKLGLTNGAGRADTIIAGVPECRSAGVPECRSAGAPQRFSCARSFARERTRLAGLLPPASLAA